MQTRTKRNQVSGRGTVTSAAAAFALVASCCSNVGVELLEQERVSVVDWTAPPNTSVSPPAGWRRTGQVAETTWTVSGPMSRAQYRGWESKPRRGTYHPTRSTEVGWSFSRLSKGDQYLVSIDLLEAGSPVRLRVTFAAHPD